LNESELVRHFTHCEVIDIISPCHCRFALFVMTMRLVDCHSHLYASEFPGASVADIVARAEAAGVTAVLSVRHSFLDSPSF